MSTNFSSGLQSYLVKQNDSPKSINLAEKFGEGYTYTVTTSNGAAVDAAVDAAGNLTLAFGTLGHSDLTIVATAADGSTLTDNIRVRVAGENAYTIAVIPDTQDYTLSDSGNQIFGRMTQWLVDNKDSLGIQFVSHVGDMTYYNQEAQWARVEASMRILDGEIPYGFVPGNHDINTGGNAGARAVDHMSKYFTVEEQKNLPGFGGVYDKEATSIQNSYQTFTAPDGTKWLNLALEFGPRDDVLDWAAEVIEAHMDHRVILTTHGYMAGDERVGPVTEQLTGENAGPSYGVGNDIRGAADGDQIWQKLVSKYPNIAFTLSGHNFIDGAQTQVNYGAGGQPVLQMLMNYQNGVAGEITSNGGQGSGNNGGNGAIRLITIDPDTQAVYTETYFTEFDDYLDGYRGKPELDRDGLTGHYLGHQESFTGIDLSTPDLVPFAKAGKDITVRGSGDGDLTVTLDASASIVPAGEKVTYTWKNSDGETVAIGATATIQKAAGTEVLTLEIENADGYVSQDQVRVTVANDDTLLTENFNTGTTAGWSAPKPTLAAFGTTDTFNIPAMDGGDAEVLRFPHYTRDQHLIIKPDATEVPAGGLITSYTFVMDVNLAPDQAWWAMFQADTANRDDADFYLRRDSNATGSLGISNVYQGDFEYNAWQRIAVTFQKNEGVNGAQPTYTVKKYIEGVFVGEQTDTYRGGRFDIDANKGVLLFTDGSAATQGGYVNSVLFADRALSAEEITSFGKASAGGISDKPVEGATQFDFTDGKFTPTFGSATLDVSEQAIVQSPLKVVGSVFSDPANGEGTLKDLTNGATNKLLWVDEEATGWTDYAYEISIGTVDNSGKVGVLFRYQDEQNHYRLTFDVNGNARSLVKVQNGTETEIAKVAKGIVMGKEHALKVVVSGNEITAFLDDKDIFGGPVVDANPIRSGTVGVISEAQKGATFDDIIVNKITPTAHGESLGRVIDLNGDGTVEILTTAKSSFGVSDDAEYRWLVDGKVVATGADATLKLKVGTESVVLEVEDGGQVSRDVVKVETVAKSDLVASDDFSSSPENWIFVNEGENNVEANWRIEEGRLVQDADVLSRQLTNGWNASSGNIWDRGWSPHGDGDYILRKGTYALFDAEGAAEWNDYSVQATVNTGGNDAVGLLFYYQDDENYYKLELDNETGYIQMIRHVDGIETVLSRTAGKFEVGTDIDLRLDVKDHVITATLDGNAIFANTIEDKSLEKGTVGLYNWGAAGGVSYDDVQVISLKDAPEVPGNPGNPGTGNPGTPSVPGEEIVASPAGGRLLGTAGNDKFIGNVGLDTVVYLGVREAYQITLGADGSPASIIGPEGSDTFLGIERIAFNDGTLAFDIDGNAGQGYRLYQAAFDRAPDAEGLGYWIDYLDTGRASLGEVADHFLHSAEFAAIYGTEATVSDGAFVDLLYENALGREAEEAGYTYWVDNLSAGEMDRSDLLAFFSESLENKTNTAPDVANGIWFA